MMRISIILAGLVALCATQPARAQVIEIGDNGEALTYDGPTLFLGAAAEPIRPPESPSVAAAGAAPSTLLAEAGRLYGVDPRLLEAVAWQESRGRMNAVSVKGALGIMQLMPGTAAELGVNPANMADNVRGGALYLRRQLDRFGSVPLALAAYNAGPGAVLRYGGVPPYRETRDYVARIMQRWRPSSAASSFASVPVISVPTQEGLRP